MSTDNQRETQENGENRVEEAEPEERSQPLTCSVPEFASIVGISRDHAYELVHSRFPPPGFMAGRSYRIIRSRITEYLDQLYEKELEARRRGL